MKQASSHIIAIILAGGNGLRLGADVPKQFVKVGGRTILQHTLAAFCGYADQIVVVCDSHWEDRVVDYGRELQDTIPDFTANIITTPAGATGFGSLCSGVSALADFDDDVLVMVHDAVRPCVSSAIIEANLAVARVHGNAITSVESYETLFVAPESDGVVQSMMRRDGVFRAQTPQTFTLGMLRSMINEARTKHLPDAQSACVLAHQLGYELHLSQGDVLNFKITTPSDLTLFEALLKQ